MFSQLSEWLLLVSRNADTSLSASAVPGIGLITFSRVLTGEEANVVWAKCLAAKEAGSFTTYLFQKYPCGCRKITSAPSLYPWTFYDLPCETHHHESPTKTNPAS